jgi:transposase-like protein
MPWKEIRIVDQRLQFLSSYQKEEMSVADLCREYGISRPTGYRWINRYEEIGPEGLVDRSRRPHTCSHATLEPDRKRYPRASGQTSVLGRAETQSKAGDATARRGVACGQYVRQHLEPCGLDQSAEEEKTYHAML